MPQIIIIIVRARCADAAVAAAVHHPAAGPGEAAAAVAAQLPRRPPGGGRPQGAHQPARAQRGGDRPRPLALPLQPRPLPRRQAHHLRPGRRYETLCSLAPVLRQYHMNCRAV